MKKILILLVLLVVAAGVAFFLLASNLGRLLKAGIEKYGPEVTRTPVSVEAVELSAGSGTGRVRGLIVGNPDPYKQPHALRLGEVSLSVDPATVMSGKVVIRSIRVVEPVITVEGGLGGNNLKKLLANIEASTGGRSGAGGTGPGTGGGKPSEGGGGRKLQVDEFVLAGAKLDLKLDVPGVSGAIPSVTLPEIRLANLGTGPDGITPAELSQAVMGQIMKELTPVLTAEVGKLGKGLLESGIQGAAGDAAKGALEKAAGGLNNLLKKK